MLNTKLSVSVYDEPPCGGLTWHPLAQHKHNHITYRFGQKTKISNYISDFLNIQMFSKASYILQLGQKYPIYKYPVLHNRLV